ncbi:LOW QUALITY PROTEIN: cdc42 effector protein 2-like [Aplochiton taeniatus]
MPLKTATHWKSSTLRWPGKQKRGASLSVHMISLPLGDFRHLSHIGVDSRGDAFGELSALQRSSSLLLHSYQSHPDLLVTTPPNGTPPPPPKPPRLLSPEERMAQAVTRTGALARGPTHRKSHSLPLLDAVEVVEREEELPQRQETRQGLVEAVEAGLTIRTERIEAEGLPNLVPPIEKLIGKVLEEDPSFVLNLDLGPSILEDVLQVMDQLHHRDFEGNI